MILKFAYSAQAAYLTISEYERRDAGTKPYLRMSSIIPIFPYNVESTPYFPFQLFEFFYMEGYPGIQPLFVSGS